MDTRTEIADNFREFGVEVSSDILTKCAYLTYQEVFDAYFRSPRVGP